MPGENPVISLQFGVGACAEVTVSSWRAGKYDDDPMNLAFEKTNAVQGAQKPVPVRCTAADISVLGRPMMLEPENGLRFGLSLSRDKISWHQPGPLHLWIDNPADTDGSVMTCSRLDFFWSSGFDLYDAYGHRLLRKFEAEQRKQRAQNNVPTVEAGCADWVCSREFAIPIPARSCRTGAEQRLTHDFNRDLAEMYDLPPGTYYVAPRPKRRNNQECATAPATLNPVSLGGYLRLSIEEN